MTSQRLRDQVFNAIEGNVDARLVWGSLSLDGIPDATDEVMTKVVQPLVEMLTYLELHVGRYQWTVLTTPQKNLLADLIDERRARDFPDDHEPMERWWQK